MSRKITSFRDLIVWQKSVRLVSLIYKELENFPKEELFGITSQIKRCVVSIPSNIAEGTGRSSRKDFRNFLFIAYGSSLELETQLLISKEIGFIKDSTEINGLLIEVQKMLMKMIGNLNEKSKN